MRKYELIAIFPSEEELFRNGKEAVVAELAKQSATIEKEDDMGDRELAYPIGKRTRGHYILFHLSMNPQSIIAVERAFKLVQNLVKHLFVKVDE
jgi:small subunit ribosomal protein S6